MAETQPTRTERAISHLKNHPNLYTFLCVLSALIGLYADYRTTVDPLEANTETIQEKSADSEAERVKQDEAMRENIKLILDYSLTIENRLAVLETKVERLESDNSSFWQVILGKATSSSEPKSAEAVKAADKMHLVESKSPMPLDKPRLDLQFPEQKVYFSAD